MKIVDGTGTGKRVKVDDDNRFYTNSVSQSIEHFTNFFKGRSYSAVIQQTPTGASDYFFYMENTGSLPIVIEGFSYRVASAESIDVKIGVSGTPAGGATASVTNLNSNSSKSPTGTYQTGNDITGLSNGSVAERIYLTSTETKNYNFEQDVVIAQGGTFALSANTGGVQLDLNLHFYESDL